MSRPIRTASLFMLALCATIPAATPAGAQAAKIVLVAHRAVYDLSLLSSGGVNGIDEARGRLVFEITGSACEGYATNFRQVTQVSGSQSSGDRGFDVRSTSFESGDGKMLRFSSDSIRSGGQGDHVEGKAQATADGIEINVEKPEAANFMAPVGTLFPNTHIKQLVGQALSGEKLFSAKVFDGSDNGRKVYDTLAVIGSRLSPEASEQGEAASKVDQLKDHISWPVTLSYFEPGAGEQQPAYVMSFVLYDNGVSRALKINYGDFALKGELKSIEFLKVSACDK